MSSLFVIFNPLGPGKNIFSYGVPENIASSFSMV